MNFALYSMHATDVVLLLFDDASQDPTDVIGLTECTKNVWHVHVEGVHGGQLYGYKVDGPYHPEAGLRFNTAKLLLDPYAKAVTGKFVNTDNQLLAYDPQSGRSDLVPDRRDTVRAVPKAIVVDDAFDWQQDAAPGIGLDELIIYEIHAKGFTAHPSSGVRSPGTYLASSRRFHTCSAWASTRSSYSPFTSATSMTSCTTVV